MTDALNARSEILARIRSAIGRDVPSVNADAAWQAIPRNYRQAGALDLAGCVDLLIEQLHDYGAGVFRCEPSQLAATVAEILAHQKKKKMLVSPDVDSLQLRYGGDVTLVADSGLSYANIDDCDGVLTGCMVAIAATGTLVLCHGPGSDTASGNQLGQGRRALTLIPDYHLCVVRASDVVETVPEAIHILDPHREQPITFISGPSATADIEMTRIQGVHGPRVLDVVIVD